MYFNSGGNFVDEYSIEFVNNNSLFILLNTEIL